MFLSTRTVKGIRVAKSSHVVGETAKCQFVLRVGVVAQEGNTVFGTQMVYLPGGVPSLAIRYHGFLSSFSYFSGLYPNLSNYILLFYCISSLKFYSHNQRISREGGLLSLVAARVLELLQRDGEVVGRYSPRWPSRRGEGVRIHNR